MQGDLTKGKLLPLMLRFSIPYLIACFLQTFYGLADLFIVGQFNAADTITAVSVGSQLMHMVTVVLVGLATGTMISISHSIGAGKREEVSGIVGTSILYFGLIAACLTVLMLAAAGGIMRLLSTPQEALAQTGQYLRICFLGIPVITAYNVISAIFRGMGDTRRPMYFVAAAGVINIILDYLLVGGLGMGAAGAAVATVVSQICSVLFALPAISRCLPGIRPGRTDLTLRRDVVQKLLSIGLPIALQDGLIQVSFLAITAIANGRGVDVAAAVGIVEKIISFLFLVPSAMLSTVSVTAAQNAGAGLHTRSRSALRCGVSVCVLFGLLMFGLCQFLAPQIVSLFVRGQGQVVLLGGQYLRAYSLDCVFAGIHFCCSGFFTAYDKSIYSFIHNMISVVLVRIPGSWLASVLFPASLYPMGLAAPMGSLLSTILCVIMLRIGRKYWSS